MSTIKEYIKKRPNISELNHYWENASKVTFKKKNDNGFDISIERDRNFILLEIDNGYHEHINVEDFESEEEALSQIFGLARDLLSKNMRIKVISKSGKPKKWIVEYFDGREWEQESTMGLLLFNPFGKEIVNIYSNDILPPRRFEDS